MSARLPTPAGLQPLAAPRPDADEGPHRAAALLVAALVALVATLLAWAMWAELDVAVQAGGAVVPPSRLQEVQSLEGGIVRELLVQPGDRVRRGQVLVRLDTAQAEADVGESRQQQLAALAARARTDALLAGTEPRFDPAVVQEAPGLVDKELQLWRDALREYQASRRAQAEAVQRRRSELAEAESRITALRNAVKLAEESFALEDHLVREGAGARADLLTAQQRLLGHRNDLGQVEQSLPRLRAGLAEAEAQAAEADAKFRAQWGAQRADQSARAATLTATVAGRMDRAARREISAPIDGVVNRVLVNTRGGVAAPGKPILEIVPVEAALQLTVRVRPQDIGFIHVGQRARVRVLAYDAATHGQMDATVARVGADALSDERGVPYFEVQLSAARDQLRLHGQPLAIQPGMPVDVGILTGRRTVMDYLLKPVLRGVQGSLQER